MKINSKRRASTPRDFKLSKRVNNPSLILIPIIKVTLPPLHNKLSRSSIVTSSFFDMKVPSKLRGSQAWVGTFQGRKDLWQQKTSRQNQIHWKGNDQTHWKKTYQRWTQPYQNLIPYQGHGAKNWIIKLHNGMYWYCFI